MKWTGARDDFSATTQDGYILRVEQMDAGRWWWTVYGPNPNGRSFREDNPWWMDAPNKSAAMWACQCAYEQMKYED